MGVVKQILTAAHEGTVPGGGKLPGAVREDLHGALFTTLGDMTHTHTPHMWVSRTSDPETFTKNGLPDPHQHKEELVVKYCPCDQDGECAPGHHMVNDSFWVPQS